MPSLRKRIFTTLLTLFLVISEASHAAQKPKLIIAIIVDQFRYDYLTRFRADYHGGFDRLLTHGANFTSAFYAQVPTKTAVGHSIFLSGAMPAVSGVIDNAWYDRDAGQIVTSVCDWDVKTVGAPQPAHDKKCTDSDPASPARLLVTTLGDELRMAHADSKVIGVSLKARAAILPSGHAANGAYWFDDVSGNFITSSFYMEHLPAWADAFNARRLPALYVDRAWDGFPQWDFHSAKNSGAPYAKLPGSPWGNELVEQFAEEALTAEKLGQRGVTDLLTISFSSNDYVGHAMGPYAPEVRDMSKRTDEQLGKLFNLLEKTVGLQNTIIVLSADHGVAATPAQDEAMRIPGGYLAADLEDAVKSALNRNFGKQDWLVADAGETSLYFNREVLSSVKALDSRRVSEDEIYRVAKEALLSVPQLHVSRVYSRAQLDNGVAGDFVAQAEMNGYFQRRSGDLQIVFEPGYLPGTRGTTHFAPYSYDTHVPVIFMGPGIKSGRYSDTIRPNDIAPTLADMLDLQTPSGSSGRVLIEMLAP